MFVSVYLVLSFLLVVLCFSSSLFVLKVRMSPLFIKGYLTWLDLTLENTCVRLWTRLRPRRERENKVSQYTSMSMPVDFCRHLVGKTFEKCLSLWQRLNMLCWQVSGHIDIFVERHVQFYLNKTINRRHLTRRIISCYTHKMAIVSWP